MIHINDKYKIKADDHQLILIENIMIRPEKNPDELKPGEKIVGYFSTMPHALRGLYRHAQRKMIQTDTFTLTEALQAFKSLERQTEGWSAQFDCGSFEEAP